MSSDCPRVSASSANGHNGSTNGRNGSVKVHASSSDLQRLRCVQAYLRTLAGGEQPLANLAGAWESFYGIYSPLVRRLVLAAPVKASDVDDCLQHVWHQIVAKLPHFKYEPEKGRFHNWLTALISWQVCTFIRTERRHRRQSLGDRSPVGPGCREDDPAVALEQEERRLMILRALAELRQRTSATSYQVMHLRWVDGRRVAEVAHELGLTRQQVCYRSHRMKERLRQMLESGAYKDVRGK